MKSTGVVRKIDHLGRIVIPKEIRKTMKIKDGESLEIYTEEDAIFLKKSSSMNGIETFASSFVEIVAPLLQKNFVVTDTSRVIACNKEIEKTYLNQELSIDYENILNKREVYVASNPSSISILTDSIMSVYYILVPVVVQGDLVGSLFLFSDKEEIQEKDKLFLKFILKFLEKNLEE